MTPENVISIRDRFNLIPEDALKVAELFGLPMNRDAPKAFTFEQGFRRVKDAHGLYLRERKDGGGLRWKREGYVKVGLFIGEFWMNLNYYHGAEPRTMNDAKFWAIAFAEKYGFKPMVRPSRAQAWRERARRERQKKGLRLV